MEKKLKLQFLFKHMLNCGDHCEQVTYAVEPHKDEAIEEFLIRVLTRQHEKSDFLEVRIVYEF